MDSYLKLLKCSKKKREYYDTLNEKKALKKFKSDIEEYLTKKVSKFNEPFDYLLHVASSTRRRALIFEGVLPRVKQEVLYYQFVGTVQKFFKIDNMNMFQMRIKVLSDSDLHQIFLYWNEKQKTLNSYSDIIKSTIEGLEDKIIDLGQYT